VSIGVELITKPPLFFLDEPTSGLDPGTETRMMGLLRQLADQGRTVLLITHATHNIALCDKVVFLAQGGRLAFYGAPDVALQYFGVKEFEKIYDLIETQQSPDEWETRYRGSALYRQEIGRHLDKQTAALASSSPPPPSASAAPGTHRPRPEAWRQFGILTRRYRDIVLHDRKNLALLLLQAPIIAILLWALFNNPRLFNRPDGVTVGTVGTDRVVYVGPGCQRLQNGTVQASATCHVDTTSGNSNAGKAAQLAFILAATAVWLGTLNAIREISKEDAIYRRERMVNLHVLPYVASKFAVLIALVIVQSTLLFAVAAIHIQFPGGAAIAGVWMSLVLGGTAAVAVALSVSAAVSNPDRAVFAAPLVMLPQILFAGLLLPVKDLGAAQPIAALVMSRWAYEAVGRVADITGRAVVLPERFVNREALSGSPAGRWLILAGFSVAFGALAVGLQRMKDRR
jgi:hypothetical protein